MTDSVLIFHFSVITLIDVVLEIYTYAYKLLILLNVIFSFILNHKYKNNQSKKLVSN